MRSVGDFGRLLTAVFAGFAVAACGATANQASATYPAGTRHHTAQTAAAAQAGSEAQAAAAQSSASPTAAVTPSTAPSPATSPLPKYGNPNGHAYVPPAARAVSTSRGRHHVIGTGTAASCTSAAVIKAVAEGGVITFNCGPKPITITMTATASVVHGSRIVIDGGGKVTLSGGGKIRILQMNTCPTDCWEQTGPQLIVQNMRFVDGYAAARETNTSNTSEEGGGAIYVQGGQLKVVNSEFIDDRCYAYGPDLGGGAIRAYGMDMKTPIYITDDTFRGGKCSNGGALSGLYANFVVLNSLMTDNKAIGWGANPAAAGTPGGGSGGAIYTDGDAYNLMIEGTIIRSGSAREGGGAIFFVVDADGGVLEIEYSTLHDNPSGVFQNAPGIFDEVNGVVTTPTEIDSTVN